MSRAWHTLAADADGLSGDLGVRCGGARRLAAIAALPALVVTRPDARGGRGRKVAPPPVADAARELGIPLTSRRAELRGGGRADRGRAPEALIGGAFGALIKEPLLSEHTRC